MKLVPEEPKFKPTDGKVTRMDSWMDPKGNWCKKCDKAIPLNTKYCPHCGCEQ
jgi:hypothetical protein